MSPFEVRRILAKLAASSLTHQTLGKYVDGDVHALKSGRDRTVNLSGYLYIEHY
jgi:hypothetical protein